MDKKERISSEAALCLICIVLAVALFLKFNPGNKIYTPMDKALYSYQKGDYQEAMTYFAQADNANIAEATFALGAMHFSGKGTNIDIPKALSYYQKAADLNYTPAQTTLALLYMQGEVVARNPEKAVDWARKAAENNDEEAQILLAKWFENGEYIEKDIKQAVHFYEMAAKNGNIDAKGALSIIYKSGAGAVPSNIYTSKRWENSIKKQKRFENIFQNLPPDHIEKIQQ